MAEEAFSPDGKKSLPPIGRIGKFLPAAVSAAVAAAVMLSTVQWIGTPASRAGSSGALDAGSRYHMYITNRLGDALEGVLAVDRIYWIGPKELAAPVPDPECYGTTGNPDDLAELPLKAAKLLDGQALYFQTDAQLMPGSSIQYYLDDTILAITWKQVIDGGVYTFSEVKIAHPSQFRRFLAGGEFGSDKLFVTTEMAGSVNAVVASSGDFYSYRRAGTLVYDGTVRRVDNGLVDTCYIDKNGDLLFSERSDSRSEDEYQSFVDEQNIAFSLAFGPVLIRDGEINLPDYYVIGEIHDRFPRSALCQLGKLHYLLAVVNGEGDWPNVPTLHRFGTILRDSGVEKAYTLDGGQTAVIAMDGKLINAVLFGYQRRISDIIYFATAIPGKGS